MSYCIECGTLIPENGKFCPKCGKEKAKDFVIQGLTESLQVENENEKGTIYFHKGEIRVTSTEFVANGVTYPIGKIDAVSRVKKEMNDRGGGISISIVLISVFIYFLSYFLSKILSELNEFSFYGNYDSAVYKIWHWLNDMGVMGIFSFLEKFILWVGMGAFMFLIFFLKEVFQKEKNPEYVIRLLINGKEIDILTSTDEIFEEVFDAINQAIHNNSISNLKSPVKERT